MAKETLVVSGPCFQVRWGLDSNGECQARDYFEALEMADRAKGSALFQRMADFGKIYDKTKFNKETAELWVFKPQPHRFFCFFVKGKRIVIVSAYQKQGNKASRREIERAEKLRLEWLERFQGGR